MKKAKKMKLSYDDIFKYSEILNPVSSTNLLLAGKVAQLEPKKVILDLGSGKGFPSILWASIFGVQVEGFDMIRNYVKYANTRAEMLNLSHRVKYVCKDIRKLNLDRKYDVISSLGLGVKQTYGDVSDALKNFQNMLCKDGFLIIAEPVCLVKHISSEVLESLCENEDILLTKSELLELMEKLDFQIKKYFTSSKEDWELYIKPVYTAMLEIIESKGELVEEARVVMNSFKAEYDAVGRYWDMILMVVQKKIVS